jgi:hypothetical protein
MGCSPHGWLGATPGYYILTDIGVTVGNSFVGAGGLLVGVDAVIDGGDWAIASEVADGKLDVSPC